MSGLLLAAVLTLQQPQAVENGEIRIRLERAGDGTLRESFQAKDPAGRYRTILVAPTQESLAIRGPLKSAPLLQTGSEGLYDAPPTFGFREYKVQRGAGATEMVLTSDTGDQKIVKTIRIPDRGTLVGVAIVCDFKRENPVIRYLLDAYAFAPDGRPMKSYGKPDATFAPGIRPAKNGVIGDHFFRSPVATVQKGTLAASIMPDLDVLARNRYMPTIVDLDAASGVVDAPLMSYGFADYRLTGHVYFANDSSMTRPVPPQLILAHDILLDAQAEPYSAYRKASDYQWKRYGHSYFDKVLPQAMPFEEYAKVCYPAAFNEKETGGWFEHQINGHIVGGMPSGWGRHEGWVSWQPWFNQLRSAWGLRWWGKRLGNQDWVDKADKMLNLALAAPMDRGAVPTTYQSKQKTWKGSLISPDPRCYYDLTNMAWKGIWLLRWLDFEDCPRRDEVMAQCSWMASLMLSKQSADGSFPTWLDKDLKPVPILDRSAQSALPLWFLADYTYASASISNSVLLKELALLESGRGDTRAIREAVSRYQSTLKQSKVEALAKGADFLANEVVKGQYWYDFETFFSCSPKNCFQRDGEFNHEKMRDPHTLQAPQNTLCMHWTAEALSRVATLVESTTPRITIFAKAGQEAEVARRLALEAKPLADRIARWRNASIMALDTLVLTQNVWPISYRKAAYTYGGFGVQNSDGEYLDARQAQFGDTLADFGAVLKRPDYFERGVAAVRASMALINHPLHEKLGIYPNPNYPLGLQPENTGHGGTDQQNGRTGPDWGEMSGLTSMAYLLHKYGPIYDLAGRKITVDGGYAPEPQPTVLQNPTFDMKDWRMPGWSFEGSFLHWPVANPRRFNWNNGGLPFIGTCEDGRGGFDDTYRGTITSPAFTSSNGEIRLKVGGGSGKDVYVELIDGDSKQVAVARGQNSETMSEVHWRIPEHKGRTLRIRIVDNETGGWGHINVGRIEII